MAKVTHSPLFFESGASVQVQTSESLKEFRYVSIYKRYDIYDDMHRYNWVHASDVVLSKPHTNNTK